jgi:hypothetical protein
MLHFTSPFQKRMIRVSKQSSLSEWREEKLSQGLRILKLLLDANSKTINAHGLSGAAFNFAVNGKFYGATSLALVKFSLEANPDAGITDARDQTGETALLHALKFHPESPIELIEMSIIRRVEPRCIS